jgi:hypothetical protein
MTFMFEFWSGDIQKRLKRRSDRPDDIGWSADGHTKAQLRKGMYRHCSCECGGYLAAIIEATIKWRDLVNEKSQMVVYIPW